MPRNSQAPSVTSPREKKWHTAWAMGTFNRCFSAGAMNTQDCGTQRLSEMPFIFYHQIIFLPNSRKSLLGILWQEKTGHVEQEAEKRWQ